MWVIESMTKRIPPYSPEVRARAVLLYWGGHLPTLQTADLARLFPIPSHATRKRRGPEFHRGDILSRMGPHPDRPSLPICVEQRCSARNRSRLARSCPARSSGPISIGRSSADVRRSGKKLAEGIAQR